METCPEARKIMTAFGCAGAERDDPSQSNIPKLINSLYAFDSMAWQLLLRTGLAQAYANVPAVSADAPFSIPDAVVNYLAEIPPVLLAPELRAPTLAAVDQTRASYFTTARNDFKRGNTLSSAEYLCYATNYAVIGQAVRYGWPHATADDDTNAVVDLSTGTLQQNANAVYSLLHQAPQNGLDLSCSHGAVKIRPNCRLTAEASGVRDAP